MNEKKLFDILNQNGFSTPAMISLDLQEVPLIDFYPVALKIDSPKVIHKSDVGGVILNICNAADLENARAEIISNVEKAGIHLDGKDRFIAVEMVQGEEFYLGAAEDAVFGKTILFGKGGVLLELYEDICYIDIDADETEILISLKQTSIVKLFEGFRHSKHTLTELITLIQNFQHFLHTYPTISELDLNPIILTQKGFVIVDSRVKFSNTDSTPPKKPASAQRHNFFRNSSIALIGASHDPNKVGYALAKNLLDFQGDCYFVNRQGGTLLGRKCYEDISQLEQIDTAIIAIPAKYVYDEIKKLIPKGLRNVMVISAGFKEAGNIEEENKITALADEYHLNVIGPNCLGYTNATTKLNATFASNAPLPGNIALLSQSGAALTALMDKAYDNGIGFSHIISFGNMADFDFPDAIRLLQDEPSCEHICLYVEGIKDGKTLLKAIRESSKPIIFYKAGRTRQAQKAAFSHTGNLTGNYAMSTGLLRASGAYLASSIDALIYTPQFTTAQDIIILTNAGGPATILTDHISQKGKTFYELSPTEMTLLNAVLPSNWSHNNPIDIVGDATSERYAAALNIIDNFNTGLIFVIISPQFMTDDEAIAEVIHNSTKPIIPIWLGGERLHKGKAYCKRHKILFFETLLEAASILVT